MSNETHETVKYEKHSLLRIIKLAIFAMGVTLVMNLFSYTNVALNNFMSKAVGITQTVVHTCGDYIDALGR